MLEFLFWLTLFIPFWTYIGYFIALKALSTVMSRQVKRTDEILPVSLVITAYNEETRIREKIENSLEVDYPKDKLEIIVVSDASTDGTNDIVREFEDSGVKLLVMPERHGKHYGQGRGIQSAVNDVVVLSDATTFLEPDAVANIVSNFTDPSIGCVSGQDKIDRDGDVQGEGAYVRYEMMLRSLESRVGSLVGVSGCFFAVRKDVCDQWIDDMSSDFYLPIIAYMKGYRVISDETAIGWYKVLRKPEKEFTRKVRTVVHGLEVLFKFKSAMNPLRYGTFAIQLISHKLFRWLVPFCLVLVFALNALIVDESLVYRLTFAAQLVLYIMVSMAFLVDKLQQVSVFRIPAFFVMVNMSIMVAWYKYWVGEKYVVWTATKR